MARWFGILQHLLPRSRAWAAARGTVVKQVIDGLSIFPDDCRREFDKTWLDLFPQTTRRLEDWEQQWALPPPSIYLSEAQRRERLAATWKAQGGQSPGYLQTTLRAAGFDVYVHDWWIPGTLPPVARNPLNYIRGDNQPLAGVECGELLAQCGEEWAQCGNVQTLGGYLLVNRVQQTTEKYINGAGEPLMQCGEVDALCGAYTEFVFGYRQYNVPVDPTKWPYMFYVGAETFGEIAQVDAPRRTEFENLILKISPSHLWAGLFINYS